METETATENGLLAQLAALKKLPLEWLHEQGVQENGKGIEIEYRDESGESGRTRVRTGLSGADSIWAKEKEAIIPYGAWRLNEARSEGFIILCEGETDTLTFWYNGFPALGLPGASMVGKLKKEHFQHIDELFLCHDGDEAGDKFVAGILEKLREYEWKGRAYRLNFRERFGVKDASDLHVEDPASFATKIQRWVFDLEKDTPINRQFPALNVREFLARPSRERESLAGEYLFSQTANLLYGPPGVGKTNFVLSLAYHLASGQGFLCWRISKPIGVLLYDAEMTKAAMDERLFYILAGTPCEFDEKNLRILSQDCFENGIPDLATKEGQEAVQENILPETRLLVIDNISAACRSGIENDSESWLPLFEYQQRLKRQGISVLWVHHSNKSGKAQRGTGRKEDSMDTILRLEPIDEIVPGGTKFSVHFEKARHVGGEHRRPFVVTFEVIDKAARWYRNDSEDVLTQKIADLAESGYSEREISKELGISRSKVHRRLAKIGNEK